MIYKCIIMTTSHNNDIRSCNYDKKLILRQKDVYMISHNYGIKNCIVLCHNYEVLSHSLNFCPNFIFFCVISFSGALMHV